MVALTDTSIMQFGKYKGEKLANVPDYWLKEFWGENVTAFQFESGKRLMRTDKVEIMEYIEDNFDEKEL